MPAYYNEWEPYPAQWLRNLIAADLIAPGDVDERSIKDVRPDDLKKYTQCHFFAGIGGWSYALRLAGWGDDRPVWTGSCPCQPFSIAGRGRGEEDERHLWPDFYTLIATRKPSTVFGEQVSKKAGRDWLAGVRNNLGALDYEVGCGDICASVIESRQERERLFFVANLIESNAAGGREIIRRDRRPKQMEAHRQYADWRESSESGVLDDGLPPRLAKGITKGLGNAIVPQVAQAFIEAFLEVRP